MNTLLETPTAGTTTFKRQTPRRSMLDLTRGARLLGIGELVHLEAGIVEDYAEIDPALGFNVEGTILRVVSQHIATAPGGGSDEPITVALRRRDDGQEIELQLGLSRTRRAGQNCLVLTRAKELEFERSSSLNHCRNWSYDTEY